MHETEWMYIISGSGDLLLTPANMQPPPEGCSVASTTPTVPHNLPLETVPAAVGDFIGFPGGPGEGLYAHGFKAGPEGCTYLVGGTREAMDICTYPL